MKAMSKKYGWTVVGIYLGLSALDFPFCFLAVRWFGPERIGHLEHVIVSHVWAGLESVVPGLKEKRERNEQLALEEGGVLGDAVQAVNNVKEEVKGKEGSASKFRSSPLFFLPCWEVRNEGQRVSGGKFGHSLTS
jgi:hypothetical protein